MAENASLLPDLNAVADSFVTAAEHVRRLDNHPQRILAAIEGLGQRMDHMERNLITRIDTMERNLNARIDGLDTRIDGLDTRRIARMDGLRMSTTAEYVCYQLCILLPLTHAC
jgi:hypothetical protein